MPKYSKEDIAQATNVNLQDYARHMGFELKRADAKSMKIEGHGGLYVFEKGFHHFSAEKKGNAIHFAREYLNMGFQEAVESLHKFKGYVPEMEHTSFPQKTGYQQPKPPPEPKVNVQNTYENVAKQPPPPPVVDNAPPVVDYPAPVTEERPPIEAYNDPPPQQFSGGMPDYDEEQALLDRFEPPEEVFQQPPPEEFPFLPMDLQPEQHKPPPVPTAQQPIPQQHQPLQPPPEPLQDEFSMPEIPMPQIADIPVQEAPAPLVQPLAEEPVREEMTLPPKSDDKNGFRSFKYLTDERGLDKDIVNDLMRKGQIFEAVTEAKGYTFKNVAFVGTDKDNNPRYCALRSVGKNKFTQDVKNSEKKFGFCMKGTSNRVFVCESPIDVISHATMFKMANHDHTKDSRLSLGGLTEEALKQFLEDNPHVNHIVFALDNDHDKTNQKGEPTNFGQLKADKLMKEYKEKGFITQKQVPKGKDFNEDLQNLRKPSLKQQLTQLKETTTPRSARAPTKTQGER